MAIEMKCPACLGTGYHLGPVARKVLKALEDATIQTRIDKEPKLCYKCGYEFCEC